MSLNLISIDANKTIFTTSLNNRFDIELTHLDQLQIISYWVFFLNKIINSNT